MPVSGETELPNINKRWVNFVYGVHSETSPASNGIPNVYIQVGDSLVKVTDSNGNGIQRQWFVRADGSHDPLGYYTPSLYFEGPIEEHTFDDTDPYALQTPRIQTYPIIHDGDYINDEVDDVFDVRLNAWGPCNKWTDGADPVTTYSQIILVDGPIADAGADFTICEGTNANLDGAILRTATLAEWSTNTGDGTFSNETSAPNGIYHHGSGDVANGGVWLVLTASDLTSGCPEHKDSVYVSINPKPATPSINTTPADTEFCEDGTDVVLTAVDNGDGDTWRWERDGSNYSAAGVINVGASPQNRTFELFAIGIGPLLCESDPASQDVIIYDEPEITAISATPDDICSNSNTSLSVTLGGGASSVAWTSSSGYSAGFSSTSSLTPTYTPGATDIGLQTVTLTATTNTNGECPAAVDNVIVTIEPEPIADAGADAYICAGENFPVADASASDYFNLLWTENGAGNLAGAGTDSPTYNSDDPGDAGNIVTLTFRANGNGPCAADVDQKLIYVDGTPIATVGPNQEQCETTTANLTGNNGGNDLNFNAKGEWIYASNLLYNESFSGDRDGTMDGANWNLDVSDLNITDPDDWCEVRSNFFQARDIDGVAVWETDPIDISTSGNVKISFFLKRAINIEPSNDFIGVYYDIGGGLVQLDNGYFNDDFSNEYATASGIAGASMKVVVRIQNNGGGEYIEFDDIIVRKDDGLTVPTIANPTNPGSGVSNLHYGDNIFRWTVFSEYGSCTPASADLTITNHQNPTTSDAGPNDEICEDETTYTLAGNHPVVGSGEWSTGSTANITTIADSNSGVTSIPYDNSVFTWTITNGTCPPSASNVTINRNRPVAPGTLAADQDICENGTPVGLTGTAATGGDGTNYTYEWEYSENSSGGPWTAIASSDDPDYSPGALTTTTWYHRLVSSGDPGCLSQQDVVSTNVIEITVEPELLPGSISNNQSICVGQDPDAFDSDAPATGGGVPAPEYKWYHRLNAGTWSEIPGETGVQYNPSDTLSEGTHYFYREAISPSGVCAPVQTNEVNIIVNPGPAIDDHIIAGDASKCEDDSITLTYPAVANATEYVWDFDWLVGQVNATTATPTITIQLNSYTFTSPSEDVQIFAAGINGCNIPADYPWSVAHDLTVYANPVANAGVNDTVCDDNFITLGATASVGNRSWSDLGTGPGTVSFDDGTSATALATATLFGTYSLQWEENNGGCIDNDNVTITYWEQPTGTTAPANRDLCGVLNAALAGTGHGYQGSSTPSPEFLWEWVSGPDNDPDFGDSSLVSTTVTVDYYGTYQFRLTETNGTCTRSVLTNIIFSENPVNANAGPLEMEAACDANSIGLTGTAHSYLAAPNVNTGSRTWEYVSGLDINPGFGSLTDPTTTVTVGLNQLDVYELKWEETNGACTVRDTVIVKFYEDPDAIVGSGPYEADCGDLDVSIQ